MKNPLHFPIIYSPSPTQESTVLVIPKEFFPQFQQLCQRAGNLWPDASPEMKAFIDLITEGKVQQDYEFLTTGAKGMFTPTLNNLLPITSSGEKK